jgi:2-iminobutanoate/2-iminopropanoate deaminase
MRNVQLTFNLTGSVLLLLCASTAPAQTSHRYIQLDQTARFPFSDAVQAGSTLYVSGQLGIDPATGKVAGGAEREARLALDRLKRVIEAADLRLSDVVSVQVFCTDLSLYDTFNTVYRSYFLDKYPARALVGVKELALGAHFEIMATAVREPARAAR